MDLIWLPDAHIHNFQSIKRRSLLSDFELLSVVSEANKTKMIYIAELEVVIYCPMNFESYPLDSQTCSFEMSSFGYSSSYVDFKTKYVAISEEKYSQLDYYVNINSLPDNKTLYYERRPDEYGEFPRAVAGFEIQLQRKFKKYIFYHYVPTGVLTLISNVSLSLKIKYVIVLHANVFINSTSMYGIGVGPTSWTLAIKVFHVDFTYHEKRRLSINNMTY